MADFELNAEMRNDFGKGFARRARTAGKIPAVLYGHGADTIHLLLPSHQTFLIVKDSANALIRVTFEGKEHLALVKDIQRHPVRRDILHMDLLAVKAGEKVDVEVAIVVEGEPASGTVVSQDAFHMSVKAPVTNIPEHFIVDVTDMPEGEIVKMSDVKIPDDVVCESEPEEVVLSIMVPQVELPEPGEGGDTEAAEEDADAAEAEADEEGDEE